MANTGMKKMGGVPGAVRMKTPARLTKAINTSNPGRGSGNQAENGIQGMPCAKKMKGC